MPIYSAWECEDGFTFLEDTDPLRFGDGSQEPGVIGLMFTIEAEDFDDAMRQYHERMGWEPYKPMEW